MTEPRTVILDRVVVDKLLPINHHAGRAGGVTPAGIVIHVTEGDRDSVIEWFNDPKSEVSAHYLVCRDGTIIRFVRDVDTAWHAGRRYSVTSTLVLSRPLENPNAYLIGIEHEGDGTTELTDPQRVSSLALQRYLCSRWAIPIDRTHIVGHHEIYGLKKCPGAIDVDRLVAEIASDPVWVGAEYPLPEVAHPTAYGTPNVVYSPALGQWLVVTRYASDSDWSFVTLTQARTLEGTRAGTPLSQMPRTIAAPRDVG